MTDKHTPGPWFVPDQTYSRNLTVDVDDGVACPGSGGAMSYTNEICTLGWIGTPEWDANARLIAAAPDMLEALRAITKGGMWSLSDNKFGAARAAIAKAEGRT